MTNKELTPEELNSPEEQKYEEIWRVIMSTKGEYTLSKIQARILQQAIASGNRGIVMFQTFAISIPYVSEFYREKRFLKGALQLPERAGEKPFKPVSEEVFNKVKEEFYRKIGKVSGV